jgi:hypothetical protein
MVSLLPQREYIAPSRSTENSAPMPEGGHSRKVNTAVSVMAFSLLATSVGRVVHATVPRRALCFPRTRMPVPNRITTQQTCAGGNASNQGIKPRLLLQDRKAHTCSVRCGSVRRPNQQAHALAKAKEERKPASIRRNIKRIAGHFPDAVVQGRRFVGSKRKGDRPVLDAKPFDHSRCHQLPGVHRASTTRKTRSHPCL